MTRYEEEKRYGVGKGSKWWPVIGFLLALCFAAIAYVLGEPALTFVRRTFKADDLVGTEYVWISRAIIFVVFMFFLAMVYAAAAPKKKGSIDERQLVKERKEIRQYQKDRRENIRNFKNLEKAERRKNAEKNARSR